MSNTSPRFTMSGERQPLQGKFDAQAQRLLETTDARYAVLGSADGLVLGRDANGDRDSSEGGAALSSSVFGAMQALAELFPASDDPQTAGQITAELHGGVGGYLMLAEVGPEVRAVLWLSAGADLGKVSYEVVKFSQWFAPEVAGRAQA
ncbi:roadblock/LC7 domain-containing protein (plasmid) [Streptomyces globisporus]|uniref:roadblock/LC7 domain-containing protein n=1 Tax=Streptomyces globisporus TaxID=1908 RepID=UPI002F90C2DB|nr:roadblock/LC7 domain-containing protein [Streptomyces globisporus]